MANTTKSSKRTTQTSKNANTDLTVSNGSSFLSLTKDDVPAKIAFLEEKLKALKGDTENVISTDILYNGQNIKDITTVKELVAISASIRARSAAFEKEVEFYNLKGKVKPFTETEKTPEEWYAIIQKAVNELINNSQIKIIESSIQSLSKYLSEETKIANDLKKIMEDATAFLD